MLRVPSESSEPRGVLFAPQHLEVEADWWREIEAVFRPMGMSSVRADSNAEAVAWVERGGLAAAILVRDRSSADGLALLRIIRSIDGELPCWLITNDPSRATIETAFSLRATCVMRNPPSQACLALAARRLL